jgi:hypothetical protein
MAEPNIESDLQRLTSGNVHDAPSDLKHQKLNALIYASLISLNYFAAPVLYIGIQTGLFKHIHTSDTMANLPTTLYLAMAWFPVIIAWLFPQASLLKTIISLSYGTMALTSLWITILMLS